ncbi:MAG: precorrin-4 C(11)-methyltransferase [Caldilinea sp.]|nr:precorrin-4 C(11)-methyltransferase [Caldilinea sp.]MDW8441574.1 precorrin-4 C(11)-methyltransferase [Caldilineaceae bacterium]
MTQVQAGTVYFIGAGPGAADLITVRGRDLIACADLVLYADSLVTPEAVAAFARPDARLLGSSTMHLDEIMTLMIDAARRGEVVARVHSGDPSIYGAIHEQMVRLEAAGVPYEIVPGVAAAGAAAARRGVELTVPDLVQTVILTRAAGRVPMPAGEQLRDLAAHGATLAIHLSVTRIRQVVEELLAGGAYGPATPVAVVHRVTWPDESYVLGTLADIADKVRAAGYTRQALILVSPALDPALKRTGQGAASHLYDKHYTHRFRKAAKPTTKEQAQPSLQNITVDPASGNTGPICIAVTRRGAALAQRLAMQLQGAAALPERLHVLPLPAALSTPVHHYADSTLAEVRRRWQERRPLVLIMATGIAVRAVAPLLGEKQNDPAVLCLDEQGRFVVPLLGGHQADANRLARQIAAITGGTAVITTASDGQGKPALDRLAQNLGWRIDPESALTHTMACLVNDERIGLWIDPRTPVAEAERLRQQLSGCANIEEISELEALKAPDYAAGVVATCGLIDVQVAAKSLTYRPLTLVVGIGCRKGATAEALQQALLTAFQEVGLSLHSLAALATVELKANEPGLRQLAEILQTPLHVLSTARLQRLDPTTFSASAAQEKFGLPGVAEPCAVLAAGGPLVAPKRTFEQCTVAIALCNQADVRKENT